MKLLFIHQNLSAQFKHLITTYAQDPKNQVVGICQDYAPMVNDPAFSRVIKRVYKPSRKPTPGIHHYVHSFEKAVLNGQAVAKELHTLKTQRFIPDVAIAHPGWGESLYFKDIFPNTPLVAYTEFFYHAKGADADFDPEFPITQDDELRIRTRNAVNLLGLEGADICVSPMQWQKQLFPKAYQSKIRVIHEGIDTQQAIPDHSASFRLPNGKVLGKDMEILTFTARSMEPYRGFHIFMRALEKILARRPNCQVLITGGDDVSYGRRLPEGQSYREKLLSEVNIDTSRVHFLGEVPYDTHLKLLQISTAHVYLTYPFVLSWSMMEAMAAECVVIASDTAPVREVIQHRKNGLLVDFFAVDGLVDAVDEVFSHKTRMRNLGIQARKHILKNYPVEASLKGYGQLFSELLSSDTALAS